MKVRGIHVMLILAAAFSVTAGNVNVTITLRATNLTASLQNTIAACLYEMLVSFNIINATAIASQDNRAVTVAFRDRNSAYNAFYEVSPFFNTSSIYYQFNNVVWTNLPHCRLLNGTGVAFDTLNPSLQELSQTPPPAQMPPPPYSVPPGVKAASISSAFAMRMEVQVRDFNACPDAVIGALQSAVVAAKQGLYMGACDPTNPISVALGGCGYLTKVGMYIEVIGNVNAFGLAPVVEQAVAEKYGVPVSAIHYVQNYTFDGYPANNGIVQIQSILSVGGAHATVNYTNFVPSTFTADVTRFNYTTLWNETGTVPAETFTFTTHTPFVAIVGISDLYDSSHTDAFNASFTTLLSTLFSGYTNTKAWGSSSFYGYARLYEGAATFPGGIPVNNPCIVAPVASVLDAIQLEVSAVEAFADYADPSAGATGHVTTHAAALSTNTVEVYTGVLFNPNQYMLPALAKATGV